MLVGRGAQLGAPPPGKGGEEHRVEVDELQFARGADHDVLGLQVAVGPVVGHQAGGQTVEAVGQRTEPLPVRSLQRKVNLLAERAPLDPVVDHHVAPDPLVGRGVEEELACQEPAAVDFRQMLGRPHVAAQRLKAPFAADAEDHRAVAHGIERPSLLVAAEFEGLQRAAEPRGLLERREVLAKSVHACSMVL